MRRVETYGSINEAGELKISKRKEFIENCKNLGPCRIRLICEKLYKKRSTKTYKDDGSEGLGQNGYYHAIFIPLLAKALAHLFGMSISNKEAHEWMKTHYWGKEVFNQTTGEHDYIPGSSADKTTVEFEEIMIDARGWVETMCGIEFRIPEPNEQGELKFEVKEDNQ